MTRDLASLDQSEEEEDEVYEARGALGASVDSEQDTINFQVLLNKNKHDVGVYEPDV